MAVGDGDERISRWRSVYSCLSVGSPRRKQKYPPALRTSCVWTVHGREGKSVEGDLELASLSKARWRGGLSESQLQPNSYVSG